MGGPEIVIIAAVAEDNRVIGNGLKLPWHLPEDLKRFKRLTEGHPLVMGRRTFESLMMQFSGPLPNRTNVVLTRHPEWRSAELIAAMASGGKNSRLQGVQFASSVEEALEMFADAPRIFIGGGADVYEETLADADRWELTFVEAAPAGDVFFPDWRPLLVENGGSFHCIASERHEAEEGRPAFRFETFVRASH